jgi:pimeloyl-ACP methyl ester carboxylesterase
MRADKPGSSRYKNTHPFTSSNSGTHIIKRKRLRNAFNGTKGGTTIGAMLVHSDDTDIHLDVIGTGPDVIFLHPFPSNRQFWKPIVPYFDSHFRLIMPDLRGLGESQSGNGIATMQRHAADIMRLCDELKVSKAVFVGCSIGGYVLFEAWRQYRERFRALVLCDTKADADDDLARSKRLQAAEDVLLRGPDLFISAALPNLVGASTQRNRPDIFAAARSTTSASTAQGIAAVQRGMAARPDSTRTLTEIDVPTLVLVGSEDNPTPVPVVESLAKKIRKSEFHVIPNAGHFAPFEQPVDFARLLRQFLDGLNRR